MRTKKLIVVLLLTFPLLLGMKDRRSFSGGAQYVESNTNILVTPSQVPAWQTWFVLSSTTGGSQDFELTIYHNSDYTDSTNHVLGSSANVYSQTPVFGSRAYRYRVSVPNVPGANASLYWEN